MKTFALVISLLLVGASTATTTSTVAATTTTTVAATTTTVAATTTTTVAATTTAAASGTTTTAAATGTTTAAATGTTTTVAAAAGASTTTVAAAAGVATTTVAAAAGTTTTVAVSGGTVFDFKTTSAAKCTRNNVVTEMNNTACNGFLDLTFSTSPASFCPSTSTCSGVASSAFTNSGCPAQFSAWAQLICEKSGDKFLVNGVAAKISDVQTQLQSATSAPALTCDEQSNFIARWLKAGGDMGAATAVFDAICLKMSDTSCFSSFFGLMKSPSLSNLVSTVTAAASCTSSNGCAVAAAGLFAHYFPTSNAREGALMAAIKDYSTFACVTTTKAFGRCGAADSLNDNLVKVASAFNITAGSKFSGANFMTSTATRSVRRLTADTTSTTTVAETTTTTVAETTTTTVAATTTTTVAATTTTTVAATTTTTVAATTTTTVAASGTTTTVAASGTTTTVAATGTTTTVAAATGTTTTVAAATGTTTTVAAATGTTTTVAAAAGTTAARTTTAAAAASGTTTAAAAASGASTTTSAAAAATATTTSAAGYPWVSLLTPVTSKDTACTALATVNTNIGCCGLHVARASAVLANAVDSALATASTHMISVALYSKAACGLEEDRYCSEGATIPVQSVTVTFTVKGVDCAAITDSVVAFMGEGMAKSFVSTGVAPSMESADVSICNISYLKAKANIAFAKRRRLSTEAPVSLTVTGTATQITALTAAQNPATQERALASLNTALAVALQAGVSSAMTGAAADFAKSVTPSAVSVTPVTAASVSAPVTQAPKVVGTQSQSATTVSGAPTAMSAVVAPVCAVAGMFAAAF